MAEMIKTRATFADYQALPETNQIVELIDGEITVNPPPLHSHQESAWHIVVYLVPILNTRGGVARFAPAGIHFDDEHTFEPDIFWISPDNTDCVPMDDRYWHGAPDLVIEILSPSTEYKDRGVKFEIYEKYGVREYWLVNVAAHYVEVYRHKDGAFIRAGVFVPGKSFVSEVLGGISVEVSAFFS
jgi:Uma2 family endonuclease